MWKYIYAPMIGRFYVQNIHAQIDLAVFSNDIWLCQRGNVAHSIVNTPTILPSCTIKYQIDAENSDLHMTSVPKIDWYFYT